MTAKEIPKRNRPPPELVTHGQDFESRHKIRVSQVIVKSDGKKKKSVEYQDITRLKIQRMKQYIFLKVQKKSENKRENLPVKETVPHRN